MLATERSFPVATASNEKPAAPHSSSQKALGETVIISVDEVVVPEDLPPDGGLRAWLVVFGVACGMGATSGILTSWGTWQAYYEENTLRTESASDIAWIGSVQSAMGYAPGLVVGRLFDLGYLRLPIFASSALFVVCMFLTAECKQYWQFLLCQGLGIGVSPQFTIIQFQDMMLGLPTDCERSLLQHRKHGPHLLVQAEAGFGTCHCIHRGKRLWMHLPCRHEVPTPAYEFRMDDAHPGIHHFGPSRPGKPCSLTTFRRLPGTRRQDLGPLINVSEFKKPIYSIYVVSLIINNLGLSAVITYITVTAVGAGIDITLSYDLVAIVNAMSALGQLVGGLLADRYGPLNVLTCSTLVVAVVTFAWPFATNVATFVVVAVLSGIGTGGYYASMVQPFELMGRLAEVGLRIGMGFTLVTVGVVAGTPLLGAIFDVTGSYKNVGYCGGSLLVLSAALMVATRHFMPKSELGVRGTLGER